MHGCARMCWTPPPGTLAVPPDPDLDLLYVGVFARLLQGRRHPLIGTNSPAPATAALLARALLRDAGGDMHVTILGSPRHSLLTDDLAELFDSAARGMFDAFFIGGGQIDGKANVNLVGVGSYPALEKRWPGSHGTPLLYLMIPNAVVYVRAEHSRRTLVPEVDFISTAGVSEPGVHRPGGPVAMVTSRCVFRFHRDRERFELVSLHPGHTLDEVTRNTGFDFDVAARVEETQGPDCAMLRLLRSRVLPEIAPLYPQFAARLARDVEARLQPQPG